MPKQYIVTFKDEESFKSFDVEKSGRTKVTDIPRMKSTVLVFDSPDEAKSFAKNNKDIKSIEEDYIIKPYNTSRKLAETIPYGVPMVKSYEAGDYQAGSGIKVCVIDDGYDNDHPDLPIATGTGNMCCFLFFGCGCPWDSPSGSHGTHVSGSIAAIGGNNQGVVGVMRNGLVPMHMARVFGSFGSTTTSNIINAMDACDEWGANVVNMSLGGPDDSNSFRQAFQDIIASRDDILFVAAAGNAGDSSFGYPASFPELISVASVDSDEVVSYYSQYNNQIDLAGPGEDVESTVNNGQYDVYSGTSMASPHVAAVAALIWSYCPTKTADEVRAAMESTAKDLGSPGRDDYYGHGLVDAEAAKIALCGGNPPSPPTPSPPTPAPAPSGPCNDVTIEVLTDNYPQETSWVLKDSSGITVASKDDFTQSSTLYTTDLCLAADECFTFTISDTFGDGICCGYGSGSYKVFFDGVEVGSGGNFNANESVDFGDETTLFDIPSYGISKDCGWLKTAGYPINSVCSASIITAGDDCFCLCD